MAGLGEREWGESSGSARRSQAATWRSLAWTPGHRGQASPERPSGASQVWAGAEGEEDIQRRGRTGNPRNRVAQGPGAASGTGGEGV